MRKIFILITLMLLPMMVNAGGVTQLKAADVFIASHDVPDSTGVAYTPADSVEVTVTFQDGTESMSATWFNTADAQASLVNGNLYFFDAWDDMNGSDGVGQYTVLLRWYDGSSAALDFQEVFMVQQTTGGLEDVAQEASLLTASDNIGINWGDVTNPTTTVGLSGTTVKAVTDAVTVGTINTNVITADALHGEAAAEIEDSVYVNRADYMADVSDVVDTVNGIIDSLQSQSLWVATEMSVNSISLTGTNLSAVADSVNLTDGTETNTYASTRAHDGVYYEVAEGGTGTNLNINYYLVFDIGPNTKPVDITYHGRLDEGSPPSGNDTIHAWAYDWDGTSWIHIGGPEADIVGINSSTLANDLTYEALLVDPNFVGTGSDEGLVRIAFSNYDPDGAASSNLEETTELFVDYVFLEYQTALTAENVADAVWFRDSSAAYESGVDMGAINQPNAWASTTDITDSVWLSSLEDRDGVAGSFGDSAQTWGVPADLTDVTDTVNAILDTLQSQDGWVATSANQTLIIDTVNGIMDTLQNQDDWVATVANQTLIIDTVNAIIDTLQATLDVNVVSMDASTVTATAIAADAIGSSEIAGDAIGAAELAANAIGASEIAASAIGASEVATDAIDADALADDAIDDIWEYASASVGEAGGIGSILRDTLQATKDLLDAGVTVTSIGAGVITASSIAADAIGSSEIAGDAIGASEIATDAIGAAEFATDAVQEIASLVNDSVWNVDTSAHVVANSFGFFNQPAFWPTAQDVEDSVWGAATRSLTELDEDNTTIDLDGSTIGTVTNIGTAGIDAIWEYDSSLVAAAGQTMGALIKDTLVYQGSAAGLTAAEVADSVWTRDTSDNVSAGSFGFFNQPANWATTSLIADSVWLSLLEARDGVAGSFGDSATGWGATAASAITISSVYDTVATLFGDSTVVVDTNTVGDSVAVQPEGWTAGDSSAYGGTDSTTVWKAAMDALEGTGSDTARVHFKTLDVLPGVDTTAITVTGTGTGKGIAITTAAGRGIQIQTSGNARAVDILASGNEPTVEIRNNGTSSNSDAMRIEVTNVASAGNALEIKSIADAETFYIHNDTSGVALAIYNNESDVVDDTSVGGVGLHVLSEGADAALFQAGFALDSTQLAGDPHYAIQWEGGVYGHGRENRDEHALNLTGTGAGQGLYTINLEGSWGTRFSGGLYSGRVKIEDADDTALWVVGDIESADTNRMLLHAVDSLRETVTSVVNYDSIALVVNDSLTDDHGAGAWTSGSAGAGTDTLRIYAYDSTTAISAVVEDATVTAVNPGGNVVAQFQTNASGYVDFTLDAATDYSISAVGPPGKYWTAVTITNDAGLNDLQDSIIGWSLSQSVPAASQVCAVSVVVRDAAGEAIKNVWVHASLTRSNIVDSNGYAVVNKTRKAKTDSTGTATINCRWSSYLIPATKWQFTVPQVGSMKKLFTVPRETSTTFNLLTDAD